MADRLGMKIDGEDDETLVISPAKEPEKSAKKPRTVIIQKAGVPLFEVGTDNKQSNDDVLPGVLNIEKVFRQQEADKREKDTIAIKVI